MPTKDIFDLVKAKNYPEAATLLQANPEWVNAVDEGSNESLLQYCVYRTKPEDASTEFMKQVLTHPKLDFSFISKSADTNQGILIQSGRSDLIKYVLNKPEFLILAGELSLVVAEKEIQAAVGAVSRAQKRKKPGEEIAPKLTAAVTAAQEVALAIREATIALASTLKPALIPVHVELLQKLQAENAIPSTATSSVPVTAPSTAIEASVSAAKTTGFFAVAPSKEIEEWEKAEQALKALELQHAQQRAALHEKAIAAKVGSLEAVQTASTSLKF